MSADIKTMPLYVTTANVEQVLRRMLENLPDLEHIAVVYERKNGVTGFCCDAQKKKDTLWLLESAKADLLASIQHDAIEHFKATGK